MVQPPERRLSSGRRRAPSRNDNGRGVPPQSQIPNRPSNVRQGRQNEERGQSGPSVLREATSPYEITPNNVISIFGNCETKASDIAEILRFLRGMQGRVGGKHRFHLLVEFERGSSETMLGRRQHRVLTRVLFSPTISMESLRDETDARVLSRVLNSISWRNSRGSIVTPQSHRNHQRRLARPGGTLDRTMSRDIGSEMEAGAGSTMRLPIVRRMRDIPSSQRAVWPEEVRNLVIWPNWFPFMYPKYVEGEQVSNEVLYLDAAVVQKFETLAQYQIRWVYSEFFEYMHKETRRKKMVGISNTLKYAQFTPPWIRTQVVSGTPNEIASQVPIFLEESCVPRLRQQRNSMGHKRLAFILAGFYVKEQLFARDALEPLINIRPNVDDSNVKRVKRSNGVDERNGERIAELSADPEEEPVLGYDDADEAGSTAERVFPIRYVPRSPPGINRIDGDRTTAPDNNSFEASK